jgi:type IV pilus assembly protein PilB
VSQRAPPSSEPEIDIAEDQRRLGDRVVDAGLATRPEVEAAAHEARAEGRPLGAELVHEGKVSERDVYVQLAAQHFLELADLLAVLGDADPALYRKVPARFRDARHVIPVRKTGDDLWVVTSEPREDARELAWALGARRVHVALVTPSDLKRLEVAFELGQVGRPAPLAAQKGSELLPRDSELDATLVALYHALLGEAIVERASDIHLERYGERVRVRMRIDGDLHDMTHYHLTPQQHAGIVNVAKVKAGLDIAERRVAQGGRHSTQAAGRKFDLRIQTQPAMHGEHLVIRLLPQEQRVIAIDSLGFPAKEAAAYRRLLDAPSGLVLVVGPTGSGKSTSLYAGLQVMARDTTRKVITVEDPIEYAIDDVQQTQVRPEVGFNFADAMRVFVREDPDVIMLGEIRDGETALEAMRASQTGHLVLSTLHCNDAIDAVQRLFDLGVHPNSVASELVAVFAQRLARRICEHCRVPAEADPALLAEVFPRGAPPGFRCFRGSGCVHCHQRGTYDRVAVVEYLPLGPDLRTAIARKLPLDALRAEARKAGLSPMREQGLDFVQRGVIPFPELRALLSLEQLAGDATPSA